MGRTRYVWLVGVLGWGLAMGFCVPLVVAAVGFWIPVVPGPERLPVLLAWSLILFPIGGYFVGVCTWSATEGQYERATRDDPDALW
jgi:hypothetical protein